MKTILITGASGFIGEYLAKEFSKNFNIIGIDIIQNKNSFFKEFFTLDIRNYKKVKNIFKKNKVDIVIHSAAVKDLQWCEGNKKEAYSINHLSTIQLYKLSRINNAKFIFISSDQVFDGKRGDYHENSIKNPINYYGKLKVLSEEFLKNKPNVAICRTAMVFGKIPENQKKIFNKIKQKDFLVVQGYIIDHLVYRLKHNQKIKLSKEEWCNPTSNSL